MDTDRRTEMSDHVEVRQTGRWRWRWLVTSDNLSFRMGPWGGAWSEAAAWKKGNRMLRRIERREASQEETNQWLIGRYGDWKRED